MTDSSKVGQVKPFADRVKTRLEVINHTGARREIATESAHGELEDELIDHVLRGCRNHTLVELATKRNAIDSDLKEAVRTRVMSQVKGQRAIDRVTATLHQLDEDNRRLRDVLHQEDAANMKDHLRVLLFRFLTTLMIAAIVLSTGWVAKTYEIPLPMLRLGATN